MSERRYRVTYSVALHEAPGISRDEVLARKEGACDAIVICSMLYPADGSFSLAVVTLDGRTGSDVGDDEVWKVWTMMAGQLAESPTLGEGKRALAQHVFDCVRDALERARERK